MEEPEGSFRYSSPDLSDSEKLLELTAYVHGQKEILSAGLRQLQSYHELLQDELESNPRAVDFLARSEGIAEKMLRLTDSVDASGAGGEDFEEIRASVMLRGVLGQCQALAAGRDVELQLDCADGLSFHGNVCQLQQVFYGVVSAMLRLVSAGRRLCVSALEESPASETTEERRYVTVAVHASGEAEPQRMIGSDAFFLDDTAPVFPIASLTAWLGIMRCHGGNLLLGQESGAPWVKLQFRANAAAASGVADAVQGGTETILVVDDEDMIWDVVMDSLTQLGYTVLLAANGREAVETYLANPGQIDLVVMDMVMPEMNGREAFEHLKRIDPAVKVLFSSGYVNDADAQYVMAAGAAGFLRKPYRLADLARQVRKLLDK